MTPADVKVVWPTAEQIARAVFVAAALEGHDPIDVLQGVGSARARAYAFLALAHEFPTVPRATLGRKVGKPECAKGARAALVAGAWSWFDLERLNAVRVALGWADMTLEDAKAAPLLYCGRAWEEFIDRSSDGVILSPSDAFVPLAGSGGDKEPAPIQSSDGRADGRALKGPTGSLREDSQDTGSTDDRNEQVEGSVTPRIEAGKVGMSAPSILQGREATRTEDLGRVVVEPVVEPGPSDQERLAAVERRKAWARGEPVAVAEVEPPLPHVEAPTPSITPPKVSVVAEKPQVSPGPPSPRPLSKVAERLVQAGVIRRPDAASTPKAGSSALEASASTPEPVLSTPAPVPAPAPPPPSSRAAALASASRIMQAAKPQPQRVTPPAQVTAVARRALNNAPPAATGKPLFAPPLKDTRNEIADTRRPTSELRGRLLNEALRGVTSFRPDPPAEKRGAVNVTAYFTGDPSPGRREMLERQRASESKPPRGGDWS